MQRTPTDAVGNTSVTTDFKMHHQIATSGPSLLNTAAVMECCGRYSCVYSHRCTSIKSGMWACACLCSNIRRSPSSLGAEFVGQKGPFEPIYWPACIVWARSEHNGAEHIMLHSVWHIHMSGLGVRDWGVRGCAILACTGERMVPSIMRLCEWFRRCHAQPTHCFWACSDMDACGLRISHAQVRQKSNKSNKWTAHPPL